MRVKLKASWLGLASVLALTLAGASLVDKPLAAPAERHLPELIPAGSLLVVQASDFSSLVHDWNDSPEKQLWLASSNYAAFSRSRLYLRLGDAQGEFATAAGLPPDMSLPRRPTHLSGHQFGPQYVGEFPRSRTDRHGRPSPL